MPEASEQLVFDDHAPRSSKAAARHARRAQKQRSGPGEAPRPKPLVALSVRQQDLIDCLRSGESAFAIGGAGTGKTYVPARIAAQKLLAGEIDKIIVARPTVSKPKHAQGFLPGKLDAKLAPWLIPVMDGLRAEVSGALIDKWTQEGRFEIASFEHMRGRTFRDCFVILDEAQNCDYGDLRLFLTRIGENAQVVVTGDMDQIDIHDTGLERVVDMCESHDLPMDIIEFTDEDVVRSQFAKAWVKAFSKEKARSGAANLDSAPRFPDTASRHAA